MMSSGPLLYFAFRRPFLLLNIDIGMFAPPLPLPSTDDKLSDSDTLVGRKLETEKRWKTNKAG